MEEDKYLNVLLKNISNYTKDENDYIVASIDVVSYNVPVELVKFYRSMSPIKSSKFVSTIGAYIPQISVREKRDVSYSSSVDYELFGNRKFYYSKTCKDDLGKNHDMMNLEITICCSAEIISFETRVNGKRYASTLNVNELYRKDNN